ncbi:hypothetical protein D3C74_493740 [compost metagenome]
MILMIRGIVEKPGVQRTVGRLLQFFQPFRLKLIMLWIGHISINGLAVSIHDSRHIVD